MDHLNARILYISSGLNGLFGLSRLLEEGYKNIFLITIPPDVAQAATVSGYVDFGDFAAQHEISIHYLEKYSFSDADREIISEWQPDILLVNGWNRLISAKIFDLAKYGGYGVHAGHPPRGHRFVHALRNRVSCVSHLVVFCISQDKIAALQNWAIQLIPRVFPKLLRTKYDI